MRHKIGFASFLSSLLSLLIFRIVDDDAGGGGNSDDIGDFVIEDEPDGEDGDESKKDETPSKPDEIEKIEDDELKKLKEEITKDSEWIEEQKSIIATTQAIGELKEKYSDFDENKIGEYLQKVAKEKGEKEADKLNNPLSWEHIYLAHFASKDKDALFDRGRGETKEPIDYEKTLAKARDGSDEAKKELFRNSKGR